ncbi:MAG: hypothetical protein ACJ790_21860 [Myxococcaceae bacterium]
MAKDKIKLVPPKPQQPGEPEEIGRELGEDPARHRGIEQGLPQSPRSGASERQGDDDDGAMEPGKGEPHEDDDAGTKREEPIYNRENRQASAAEAGNQHDGRGEFADQREVLKPQFRLGYPADQEGRKPRKLE